MADALSRRKMSSDWPILTKLRYELQRGCHTQATCLATLRKVEGRSTFLATRNSTIAVAKWGVTREFFLAFCNATFVAMRVARKIASCNMAFIVDSFLCGSHTLQMFFFLERRTGKMMLCDCLRNFCIFQRNRVEIHKR